MVRAAFVAARVGQGLALPLQMIGNRLEVAAALRVTAVAVEFNSIAFALA